MKHPSVLLDRLEGVKPNGDNRWSAKCPGHEDKDASLSVMVKDNGRVLVHCFAGCHVESVMGAVGMRVSDLYADDAKPVAPIVMSWSRKSSASPSVRAARLDAALKGLRAGTVKPEDASDVDVYARTYVDLCRARRAEGKTLDPDSPAVLGRCVEWLYSREAA